MMPSFHRNWLKSRSRIVASALVGLSAALTGQVAIAAYDQSGRYYYNPRTGQWYSAASWEGLKISAKNSTAARLGNRAVDGATHIFKETFDPYYPCSQGWKKQGKYCTRIQPIAFQVGRSVHAASSQPITFNAAPVTNYQSPLLPQSVSRPIVPNQRKTIVLSTDPAIRSAQVNAVIQAAHRR